MLRGAVVVLPFVPALGGLALSVWRFRGHDPVGGLACAIGGLLLLVVVVFRLPGGRRTESDSDSFSVP